MSKPSLRAVFLGTPAAAVPSLDQLARVAEVVAVVTRPDRPLGRSKKPQPSPIKVAALARGLEVVEADRATDIDPRLLHVDLAVVVAFGVIIPSKALAVPEHGFVNLHFSLLPRWRGASPVAAALAAGDQETGVSIMQLDEGLDTGPILAARPLVIGKEETAGELTIRLASAGSSLLAETIPALVAGSVVPVTQDEAKATYAARLVRADRRLDLTQSAEDNARKIRALTPKPGAFLVVDGEPVGITSARALDQSLATGRFWSEGDRLLVGSDGRALELERVRPAGKKEMTANAWARGWRKTPVIDP
ncbi:MAG: methionyl-tRNA formyltransferase [Acidimicrobiia bacterium]